MAERRMFAKTIIDSDAFLTMPLSAQALYFHLAMRGDDEGFVNKPRSILRTIGANDDDLNLLIYKKFIIPFDSGVVVIKHWKIHNYIRGDRIKETVYQDEKSMLEEKENGSYTFCQTYVSQMADKCQHRLGKVSIGKDSIDKDILHGAKETPCSSPTILTLILNTKEEYPITQQSIDEWTELYPGVNVIQQLKSMKGWLIANPARRKTKKGILRFINNWLAKEQDRGGNKSGSNKESESICKDTDKYSEIGFTL